MKYLNFKLLFFLAALALAIPPAWAETMTLTQETLGLGNSYPTTTTEKTIDGITFVYTDLMNNGGRIQAKASTGVIYNKTAFPGDITRVEIIHYSTGRPTTILGSSNGTDWTQVATGSGSISGNFKDKGYRFFKITRGSNAAYWYRIEITYEAAEGTSSAEITPNPLDINDEGGIFTVNCANMPDNGLGANVINTHSTKFSFSSVDNSFVTGSNYFPLTNNALEGGKVKVNYTGHALSATGLIDFSSGDFHKTAGVNYLYDGDIYIVGDVEGSGWSTEGGTVHGVQLSKNADGTYSTTVTANAGGEGFSWLYFTKSLNATNYDNLGDNRFGPVSNDANWSFTNNLDGVYCDLDTVGNLHTIKMQPGEYTITVNPATNQFMIELYEVPVSKLYRKVTNRNQMVLNKKYIFVYDNYAMGAISNGVGTEVSITANNDGTIDIGNAAVEEFTLGQNIYGHYTFNNDFYLTGGTGNNNGKLYNTATSDDNGWNLTDLGDGFGVTSENSTNSRGVIHRDGYQFRHYTKKNATDYDEYNFAYLYVEDDGTPTTDQVAMPTFTPAAGSKDGIIDVTISCTTEDATIYYTLDGSDPTASSTVYGEPIHVTATTTIKAIAIKANMDDSEVATAEYTLPGSIATLPEANALDNNTKFIFTGNVVVTYHNGNYTWLRDVNATTGGGVHNNNNSIIVPTTQGAVWSPEWNATKKANSSGRPQFESAQNIKASEQTASYEPFDRTGIELTDAHMSEYIKLNNVKINSFDENKTYMGVYVGENRDAVDYTLYNYFNITGIEVGKTYNITGVVTRYNDNAQVYPTTIELVKQAPELEFSPASVTVYEGVQDFPEPALTAPEGVTVQSYASSNTDVVTVDNEGKVTIVGVGTAVITATTAENTYYLSGTATYNVEIKAKEAAGLSFGVTEPVTATYGDGNNFDEPELTYPAGLTVTYSCEPESVATVDPATGAVTIVGAGTATVTATTEGDESHNGGSASYTINVAKANATMTFAEDAIEATYGGEVPANALTNEANLDVTYTSSDQDIATVDNEGKVTIVKAGEVTITATGAENDNYNGATATYTLTIDKADATMSFAEDAIEATYGGEVPANALTNEAGLNVTYSSSDQDIATVDNEGKVTIVKAGEVTITATGAANDNYNGATAKYTLTIDKADATMSFAPKAVTIVEGQEFTAPTLTNEAGLTVTYESSIEAVATVDQNTGAVTIVGVGETTITATGAANDNYNGTTATYTITVVAKPVVATPTFTPAAGYYNSAQNVTIACETAGVDIYYTIDGTVPTAESTKYTEAIPVGENMTIKAIAVKEGYTNSEVAEAEYVIDLPVQLAAPTFMPGSGHYTEAKEVAIACATPGAIITYKIGDGEYQTYTKPFVVDHSCTVTAKVTKDDRTVWTENQASATYTINMLNPVEITDGYYQIKNKGNDKYAHVQGRKTMTFTNDIDQQAGTVIRVQTKDNGQVQVLRSQAADLQGYADRAMRYVPEVVQMVANKLHAEGTGEILGNEGLDAIMEKFNESFDYHLYVEGELDNARIYGKTPSMQPVVDFYNENQAKVDAKLPMLEGFINDAIQKVLNKTNNHGASILVPFSLDTIWNRMGGTLIRPVDAESTMAFYHQVLTNKQYVWDFAYQTATFYLEKVKAHPKYQEMQSEFGEYSQYIDKLEQIRPDTKYFIVQNNGKVDYISEGNVDIINNAPNTYWNVEPRKEFKVNFPIENVYGGNFVTTLYTDFAYDVPKEVTAYKVKEVNENGNAVIIALNGTIPAQTPVLLVADTCAVYSMKLNIAPSALADTTGNQLHGPDYLIEKYMINTPQVESLFDFAKETFGQTFYDNYVAQYEHLMRLSAGTVNNRYFWGLTDNDLNKCTYLNENNEKDCVTRTLSVENQKLGFYSNWEAKTNQAFLVSEQFNPIKLSLRRDVNRDGKVTIADVSAQINILLALPEKPYLDVYDYDAADFNENGVIKIDDVSGMINYLLTR